MVFQYILSLHEFVMKKSKWSQEEKMLLRDLESKFKSKKWKEISRQFKNHGFQRTQVQCRQKWVNELNPNLRKSIWTDLQLSTIFQNFAESGSHWSIIEKKLHGRTQNMIKNKFYSLLRNIVRFILRIFRQNAESTKKILNHLTTKCLQNIYCGKQQFSFLGDCLIKMFELMGYQINRNFFKETILNQYSMFKKLYRIIKNINPQEYISQGTNNIKIQYQQEQSGGEQISEQIQEKQECKIQERAEMVKQQQSFNPQMMVNYNNNFMYCFPYSIPETFIHPNLGMMNPYIKYDN